MAQILCIRLTSTYELKKIILTKIKQGSATFTHESLQLIFSSDPSQECLAHCCTQSLWLFIILAAELLLNVFNTVFDKFLLLKMLSTSVLKHC